MNILLTSIGRRGLIVKYFKEAMLKNGGGKVYTTDADFTAPAIYFSDGYFIVPEVTNDNYIDTLIDICKDKDISAILSFIDPELEILARNEKRFKKIGTTILMPNEEIVELCYDKYKTYEFLFKNNLSIPITYNCAEKCICDIKSSKSSFPFIVKPSKGSASKNIQKVENLKDLRFFSKKIEKCIIQEYLSGREYGIDVLVDLEGEVVAVFAKRKLGMRAGETDKAISVKDPKLLEIGVRIGKLLKGPGPLDIDVFEKDGEFVINEINPRFGGGYPAAYESGIDFTDMIIKMLHGEKIVKNIGNYKENICFSKYDHVVTFEAASY